MKCNAYELGFLWDYKYVVTFAAYGDKWIFCKHRKRDTWECSGGHIEPGETPLEAAKRELYEETGSLSFDITPICDYWACDEPHERRDPGWACGVVFFARVKTLGSLPESEMEKIGLFDAPPEQLTYPDIMEALYPQALRARGASGPVVITIDGPAGSGKGTVAARLADALGYLHLDTGMLYRAVTKAALLRGIAHDSSDLCDFLGDMRLDMKEGGLRVNNMAFPEASLRTPEINAQVPRFAALPAVRARVLAMQRRIRADAASGLVAEGRDIGSMVFPDARWRFYLTASASIRAMRRLAQQAEKGMPSTYEAVLAEIIARDEQDTRRAVSPLIIPQGALVIDCTDLTIDDVVEGMLTIIRG